MKKILILIFFLIPSCLYAQKMPDRGFNKVRVTDSGLTIMAEIIPVDHPPKAKPGIYYFWYGANLIHATQGGYSGKLLNGEYDEYYQNKNLKQKGVFKKGLKDGDWKTWNEDGSLSRLATWKNGVIVLPDSVSFWKKLNIFRKRDGNPPVDSIAKPR